MYITHSAAVKDTDLFNVFFHFVVYWSRKAWSQGPPCYWMTKEGTPIFLRMISLTMKTIFLIVVKLVLRLSARLTASVADIPPIPLDVGRLPTATVRGAVLSLATDRVDSGRFAGFPTSCSDRTEIFLTMLANSRKTFL